MGYRLAVFDMDGTILDTLEDLKDSLNTILEKYQMPTHSREAVCSFVGNGIRKLIQRAVPSDTSEEMQEKVYYDFLSYYQDHCAIKTCPYPGICELIEQLKDEGVLCAVVSNKSDPAVKKLCVDYFDGMFDAAAGDQEGYEKKPAPDLVNLVLSQLRVEKKDAVYIGDSEVDIQTAVNSGLDQIIVTWGFRDRQFQLQNGAQRQVDTPAEIAKIILDKET